MTKKLTANSPIKFGDENTESTSSAVSDPRTAQFMKEFFELCEKHKMFIVPKIDCHFVNFHDGMIICPHTPEIKKLIEQTTGVVD